MKLKRQRQTEARERDYNRGCRTPAQQLALLDKRPGKAKKERARLTARAGVK